jgi:hypothetical protein
MKQKLFFTSLLCCMFCPPFVSSHHLSFDHLLRVRCLIHNAHLRKIPRIYKISVLKITLFEINFKLYYYTKLCAFHKRKFPKLTPKTQVSFVNEAPDYKIKKRWLSNVRYLIKKSPASHCHSCWLSFLPSILFSSVQVLKS